MLYQKPGIHSRDKLLARNQVHLQGDNAKQQIAIRRLRLVVSGQHVLWGFLGKLPGESHHRQLAQITHRQPSGIANSQDCRLQPLTQRRIQGVLLNRRLFSSIDCAPILIPTQEEEILFCTRADCTNRDNML